MLKLHATEIIRLAGLMDETWFTEFARDRGIALHRAIELDCHGELDEATIDPSITARFAEWRRFRAEKHFEVLRVENHVEHPNLFYVGRYDLLGMMDARKAIVDIKPRHAPWHAIQTALYVDAISSVDPKGDPIARFSLTLEPPYRLIEHTLRTDFRDARAAYMVAHWRVRNGLARDFRPREGHDGELPAPGGGGGERPPGPDQGAAPGGPGDPALDRGHAEADSGALQEF